MLKEIIKNPLNFFYKGIFLPLLGWIFIIPFMYIVPRKKNRIVFWGRDKGEFTDNVKYLFLRIINMNDFEPYFLTESHEVVEDLRKNRLPVLFYPSIKTVLKLIRTGIIITDSDIWVNNYRYHLLFTSYKVQLWHGVGLKKIGLDNFYVQKTMNYKIMQLYHFLKGRFVTYDLLISTSEMFSKKGYPGGLNKKKIINSGYPRNDVFFDDSDEKVFIGTDRMSLERIVKSKKNGFKTIIYLPTFRDSKKDAVTAKVIDLVKLDEFCVTNKILFIFKFHSWGILKDPVLKEQINNSKNVIFYDNSKDIYPALPNLDIMISDYSSVYMDFLLLNKPILFFTYDLLEYEKNEREFYYDYETLTPGAKCCTQEELLNEILRIINDGEDIYKEQREELCKKTFEDCDGKSSDRIVGFLKNRIDKGEK